MAMNSACCKPCWLMQIMPSWKYTSPPWTKKMFSSAVNTTKIAKGAMETKACRNEIWENANIPAVNSAAMPSETYEPAANTITMNRMESSSFARGSIRCTGESLAM